MYDAPQGNLLTTATIIKQSSNPFRVNAPELDNPNTLAVDVYNQYNAQVVMDATGGFVSSPGKAPWPTRPASATSTPAASRRPVGSAKHIATSSLRLTVTGVISGAVTVTTEKGSASITVSSVSPGAAAAALESALHSWGYDAATHVTVQNATAP